MYITTIHCSLSIIRYQLQSAHSFTFQAPPFALIYNRDLFISQFYLPIENPTQQANGVCDIPSKNPIRCLSRNSAKETERRDDINKRFHSTLFRTLIFGYTPPFAFKINVWAVVPKRGKRWEEEENKQTMKLSWLAAIITALVLRATLVLPQDEFTESEVDPGLEPALKDLGEPVPEGGSENNYTGELVLQEGNEYDEDTAEEEYYNVIPHLPEECSDIRIFSVRGSDEPYPGRGGAMLGVLCSLFEPTGVSCDYEDVVYPANISYSGIFCESANIGAYAGQAQMTECVQRCPDSRLVLTGYSQGGSVVGDILGGGGGPLFGCEQPWNPSLPRNTAPGSNGKVFYASVFVSFFVPLWPPLSFPFHTCSLVPTTTREFPPGPSPRPPPPPPSPRSYSHQTTTD